MRRIVRWIVRAAVALIVFVVAAYLGVRWLAAAHTPKLDGVISAPGLQHPVRATRDDWGVPHIEAQSETDAYFALGYCMAQDRLFQMEMLRRVARGELAEILGKYFVPVDEALRTFRLRANAEASVAMNKKRFPEAMAAAQAFIDGVNNFQDTQPAPFEMVLLHIPKRAFSLVDSMAVGGILPIMFSYGPRQDAMQSILQKKFPNIDMRLLFPGYTQGVPATIMETLDEAKTFLNERKKADAPGPQANSPAMPQLPRTTVAALQNDLQVWQELANFFGNHMGSNSWVLAPSRTQSRGALLANDPHIGYTNPSILYEAHVKYGDYENYGYHLPLIPFSLLGHNTDRGWGLTMFANDDVDLYTETVNPDNPNQVRYRGEWKDMRIEHEIIHVRFGQDIDFPVRISEHGPLVTPFLKTFEDYAGADDVSLYWVWQHVDYTDMAAFYQMGHARDYDHFAEAVKLVTSPGVNVSYADRRGNIAWWAAGKVLIRAPHVNNKALLDGASGNDEPTGFLPFELNPHLLNPPCGYIATANNKSTVKPVGPIPDLEGYWQPWDRAQRIEEMIESRSGRWSVKQVLAMQEDDYGIATREIIPAVSEVLQRHEKELSGLEKQALTLLGEWNGCHDEDAAGPTIYNYMCDAILLHTVGDELGENNYRVYGTIGDAWNFLKYVVHTPDSPFWDDVRTPEKETRDQIMLAAWHDAVLRLYNDLGGHPGDWTWGRVHTITFRHPFGYLPVLGKIFNIGPFPVSGGAQTIDNLLYPHGTFHYDVIGGPATRRVIDFGDPEHAYSILPTGNSGHWLSRHYADQAPLFARGEHRELRYTEAQISEHTEHVLVFEPAVTTEEAK